MSPKVHMRIPPEGGTTNFRRGAIATEMAILLPFISFLFLVAIDFCRVFYYSQTIQGCAEAGALYASGTVKPTSTTTATAAAQQAAVNEGTSLSPAVQTADVTVTIANGVATVTVTHQFQTFVTYPALPSGITITRTVQMPVVPATGQ